jgi:hypothetical protein
MSFRGPKAQMTRCHSEPVSEGYGDLGEVAGSSWRDLTSTDRVDSDIDLCE